jgi:hypothetical protein
MERVMDDLETLRAENRRLRDLLDDHGIDPDPTSPEPEQFGPPTLMEHTMRRLFAQSAARMMDDRSRWFTDRIFLGGTQWPDGMLKVRVPADFTVRQQ